MLGHLGQRHKVVRKDDLKTRLSGRRSTNKQRCMPCHFQSSPLGRSSEVRGACPVIHERTALPSACDFLP